MRTDHHGVHRCLPGGFRLFLASGAVALMGLLFLLSPDAPSAQAAECPNEAIRQQQGSTHLPLCMAYELVSPADQLGADIDFGAGSTDGDHAWACSTIPITTDALTGNIACLAAKRTPEGWVQRQLASTTTPGNESFQLLARSADSSGAIVLSCPNVLIGCGGSTKIERVRGDGSRTVMFNVHLGYDEGTPALAAASDDLSSAYVQTEPFPGQVALPEDTHTQGQGLYLSHEGSLEYIGRDENGDVLPCGAVLANGERGTGFEQNGISADGSTAFYEAPDPSAHCPEPVDLYVRRDGHSVDVSAPRNGNPDEGASYLGNSRDGDTVYFLTKSRLLPSDADAFADIYAYDVAGETLTAITSGAEVEQAVVSPQGDYVYFKAFNPIGGEGQPGHPNLFVYHEGQIRYITTPDDPYFLGDNLGGPFSSPLTPDGRHLLFLSKAPLTGQPLGGTEQLFQYDFEANSFACVSCPPDGSVPTSSARPPGANPTANADQRFQSDDGQTVVFMSRNALVPQDVNTASDVYLWHEGTLSLISSGHGELGSQLVSTDAAGRNVFFTASDRLTPEARQDNSKLYDARVDGGFLFTPRPAPCSGDGCRAAAAPPPTIAAPGSASPSGAGNPKHHRRSKHARKHHRRSKHHRREHGGRRDTRTACCPR